VVNPNSGPGADTLPDGNYTREISRLNSYANTQLVGYVATNWGQRNTSAMLDDIGKYGNWSSASNGTVSVRGIFFDEIPTQFTPANAKRLQEINAAVKLNSGLGSNPFVCGCLSFSMCPWHDVPYTKPSLGIFQIWPSTGRKRKPLSSYNRYSYHSRRLMLETGHP
jgi:hypothetical protein